MILFVSLVGILGGHQLLKIVQVLNSVDYGSVSIGAIADVHDPHSTPLFCGEGNIQSYAVCNGFSNQILGHAAFISDNIMKGESIRIQTLIRALPRKNPCSGERHLFPG